MDGVRVLDVRGKLDEATAQELRAHLYEAGQMGDRAVVVDLCSVEFIGSLGVTVVIEGCRQVEEGGGRLVVACLPTGIPACVFALIAGHHVLDIYDDRVAALDACWCSR